MKRTIIILLVAAGLCLAAVPAGAAPPWQYPVIKGYGPIVSLPRAAVQPDKSIKYKILFDIVAGAKKKGGIVPGLGKVARLINVFASGGMPPSKLKLVAVFHGPSTDAVMTPKAYLKKHGRPNPNLKVISELKKAGVLFYVCGQALAEHSIRHADVSMKIKIALSALTVVPTYQLRGYAYLPF
jgi:intracellular sulfur oxidation DsrE/DsrF family protein